MKTITYQEYYKIIFPELADFIDTCYDFIEKNPSEIYLVEKGEFGQALDNVFIKDIAGDGSSTRARVKGILKNIDCDAEFDFSHKNIFIFKNAKEAAEEESC